MRVFKHINMWKGTQLDPFSLWEFSGIWERLLLLCRDAPTLSDADLALLPMFDTERTMDSNNDGVVDRREWLTAGGSADEFVKSDLDGDGQIDPYEMKMRVLMMGQRHPAAAPPPTTNVQCGLKDLPQYGKSMATMGQHEEIRVFGARVWSGCVSMTVSLIQHTGDAGLELYLRHVELPSHDVWDMREMVAKKTWADGRCAYQCILDNPADGLWYIGVAGVHIYQWDLQVDLQGQKTTYQPPELLSGCAFHNASCCI